jgi:hypothetical protein
MAMDGSFDRQILAKLPLADAVLSLSAWCLEHDSLTESYELHRGRCHTRILAFPDFVRILWDCLSGPWGSARSGLLKASEEGRLDVSLKAFYGKLARVPTEVTLGFFQSCADRLRQVFPTEWEQRPQSLLQYSTILLDGKVIKHVPRRMRALRYDRVNACKLLGARSLVACDRWKGLVYDLVVDLDGEANEVKQASELLDRLKTTLTGLFLMVGDRAFGVFDVCRNILAHGGEFLLRKHGATRFQADPDCPTVSSTDRFGRIIVEQWGSIVRGKKTKSKPQEQIPVRLITIQRDKENLTLITSLKDSQVYPVEDLLDAYLDRWDIEQIFQTVTEVFHLNDLFSTTPQGMLFQLGLCFLMYNVIQAVKQYIAHHQHRDEKSISIEMLFRDVQEELIAATRLLEVEQVSNLITQITRPEILQQRLTELLRKCWCDRWKKANYKPRDPSLPKREKPPKIRQEKSHDSVHRILQRSRE